MQLTTFNSENSSSHVSSVIMMEETSNYKKQVDKRLETSLLKRIPLDRLMDLKIDYGATCSVTTR